MIRTINRISEPAGIAVKTVYLCLAAMLVSLLLSNRFGSEEDASWYVPVLVLTSLTLPFYFLYLNQKKKRWLQDQHERMLVHASENNIPAKENMSISSLSPSLEDQGEREEKFQHVYGTDDLAYGEYSFAIFRRIKKRRIQSRDGILRRLYG